MCFLKNFWLINFFRFFRIFSNFRKIEKNFLIKKFLKNTFLGVFSWGIRKSTPKIFLKFAYGSKPYFYVKKTRNLHIWRSRSGQKIFWSWFSDFSHFFTPRNVIFRKKFLAENRPEFTPPWRKLMKKSNLYL